MHQLVLNNFIFSYNENECEDFLGVLGRSVKRDITLDIKEKERVLDFLESLEEVLPAFYQVYSWIDPATHNQNET